MSENLSVHPASRLSGRAVIGGFLVTLSTFISLLALVAALTGWSTDVRDLSLMGSGFWAGLFAAWVAAVYAGGFVAARSLPTGGSRSGILNAAVVWAGATVFATWVLMMATNEVFDFTRAGAEEAGTFRIVFFGNLFAAGAAVLAGTRRHGFGSTRTSESKTTHARPTHDVPSRSHG